MLIQTIIIIQILIKIKIKIYKEVVVIKIKHTIIQGFIKKQSLNVVVMVKKLTKKEQNYCLLFRSHILYYLQRFFFR